MTRQEFIYLLASKLNNCPVLKSLAIAQACIESQFGQKSFYNNIYGIKCHDINAYAGCRLGKTSEVIDGSYVHGLKLAFQTYDNIDDSIADYCRLMNISRYKRVREATNYIDATQAVKDCGFATSLLYVKSLRRLIRKYNLTEYDSKSNMNTATQITINFRFGEFYCLGVRPPEKYWDNIKILARELQKLRDIVKRAIVVTSGYRTSQHNKNIGGAKDSQHLYGKAADIKVSGIPSKIVPLYVCRYTDLNGIGISYNMNSITHVDTRDKFTNWCY